MDQQFPDDEEDDFNPQQEIGSDDEGTGRANADGDDADDGPSNSRSRSSRREEPVDKEDEGDDVDADNADEQDEDDDEEDEEDDEDDDIEGQPSRKRRKRRRNQFIDVEAEVDEDDEEEPEEEDDLPGEEMHPDDLQELPPGADRDDRMHRELDRQREREEAMDVEETAARLRERYGRQNLKAGAGSAIVPQRLLLPTTKDPRIWRMKCKPGKEREIIFTLQHRILERERSREPIKIISAFERSGPMAGSIYVEARRQEDVEPALQGIPNMFMSYKPMLVPLEEMPDLLRTKKSKQLEPGMYVRMKRNLYAGDLALVEDVEPNGTTITIKLVPRLDYGLSEDSNAAMEADRQGGLKRKKIQFAQRPPARLFSETEARKRHSKYLTRGAGMSGNSWNYQGKTYVDGFLIEDVRLSHVQTEEVNPTLEEVTKFASGADDGTENLDLAALAATLKTSQIAHYLPGDRVEIYRGEQRGVSGRAVQVYGDVVRLRVEHGSLVGQTVEAPARDLRKVFKEGDHVKVVSGSKYTDEVGMVVRIKDDRVTILTDSNQQEIIVFSRDLREATDSGAAVGVNKYDLFDLVQLDAATVGCVVKVDRESLRVLDQLGNVRSLLPSNVSNKIERRNGAVATDREANEIRQDDTVKEYGGDQKTGRVLHLHRNYVFAHNRESTENAGVFVARAGNIVTVAAKGGRLGNDGPDLSKMNPALKTGGAPALTAMPPPIQKGRDRLIGRTVKIRAGPQKGMIGIVVDATEAGAIVELHAKNKKLNISKDKLGVIDANTGKALAFDSRTGGGRPGGLPGRPPVGGQTPSRGFAAAPSASSGARTPAWKQDVASRTPAWKQDVGSRTPYGGQTSYGGFSGGQTSYGNSTSYGGGSVWGGGTSAWNTNTGGRTPAHNAGGKTPAYTGGMEAPTPDFSAPTPGGYDQPTPGGFKSGQYATPASYNTPGGFPETPAPYSAETPAAFADDGPRYE